MKTEIMISLFIEDEVKIFLRLGLLSGQYGKKADDLSVLTESFNSMTASMRDFTNQGNLTWRNSKAKMN
ncbi:MAG: hypothetical protein WAM14_02465 [Candidatus Nitrosopolaris sp.]